VLLKQLPDPQSGAPFAALEAAQRSAAPAWSLPVAIVEYGEDGQVLRVVREVSAKPPAPLDFLALVAELWGEHGKSDLLG
jgi:hypothetical protein